MFAADQNGAYRSKVERGRAKASGMQAGEPDLRLYFPKEIIRHIEVKAKQGSRSANQKKRHANFRKLGHKVITIKADTPRAAITVMTPIVMDWLAEFGFTLPQPQIDEIAFKGLDRKKRVARK